MVAFVVEFDEHCSLPQVVEISPIRDSPFCSDIVSSWIPKTFSIISLCGY